MGNTGKLTGIGADRALQAARAGFSNSCPLFLHIHEPIAATVRLNIRSHLVTEYPNFGGALPDLQPCFGTVWLHLPNGDELVVRLRRILEAESAKLTNAQSPHSPAVFAEHWRACFATP